MPKKESYQKGMTKEKVYSHLEGLKTNLGKVTYLNKILEKKGLLAPETYKAVQDSTDETYGKMAVENVEKGLYIRARDFVREIRNKELADEIYKKLDVMAGEKGKFSDIEWFAERFADEIYRKVTSRAIKKDRFDYVGWIARKHGISPTSISKESFNRIYGKVALRFADKGKFRDAEKFAGKAGEYLKQNHPKILADIYEETGEVIKAKNLRKRLERESKKK